MEYPFKHLQIKMLVCLFIFAILLSFHRQTNEQLCVCCSHRDDVNIDAYIPLHTHHPHHLHQASHILTHMWILAFKLHIGAVMLFVCFLQSFISFSLEYCVLDLLQLLYFLLHFYHMCIFICIRRMYKYLMHSIGVYTLNVEKICVFHVTTFIDCIGIL